MPLIMHAPYPFEFVRDGNNLLWHNEEYDTVRTIHMAPPASLEEQPDSLLGYSVGRWEDDRTLVVTCGSRLFMMVDFYSVIRHSLLSQTLCWNSRES